MQRDDACPQFLSSRTFLHEAREGAHGRPVYLGCRETARTAPTLAPTAHQRVCVDSGDPGRRRNQKTQYKKGTAAPPTVHRVRHHPKPRNALRPPGSRKEGRRLGQAANTQLLLAHQSQVLIFDGAYGKDLGRVDSRRHHT